MNSKQCTRMLSFILIFVVLLTGLTYSLRQSSEVKRIFMGFYAEKRNTVDVAMIGSSPIFPFYSSPKIYGEKGYTCYPLSSNVQHPKAALPLIKEAERYQSPDLYVFEMRMYTMTDERMLENMAYTRGVTDGMKYSINRIAAINRLVPSLSEQKELVAQDTSGELSEDLIEDRYTYYFDIFKYHSNWKTLIHLDQMLSFAGQRKNALKGFVINYDIVPLYESDRAASLESIERIASSGEKMDIPAEQQAVLEELLAYLDENNKQALFIVSPYNVTEDEMKMYNSMSEIIGAHGYKFDNFNAHYDELGMDFENDYYDGGSHVNLLGAKKCTKRLEILLEDYKLADHRGEKKYTSWDKAYETYVTLANSFFDGIESQNG